MATVKLIEKVQNFDKLVEEINQLVNSVGFSNNQIILQGLDQGKDEWSLGTGSIEELDEQDEKKYQYINTSIENSEISKIIKKYRAYRSRIMIMNSRKCYSVHKDPTPRIHIPLITNDQCWMIWPTEPFCVKLKPGFVYWTNTTKEHTFINGGLEDRIHIVMCVDSKFIKETTNVST